MKHMKFWRTALVAALVLTVMLSVTGGTIAWFTDTVTSGSNIITSGTLTAAMQWADGTEAVPTEDSGWTDAEKGTIFNYDKWEPGYTEVRHIRIQNTGNLAFKYQLNIVPTGEVSELADVIDVYYFDPAKKIENRAALAGETVLGTLKAALADMPESTSGVLLPANTADGDNPNGLPVGEVMVTVALKMQESAGNEYQGKSIGSQFAVQLLATQLAFEEDSFDDQYDSESKMTVEIEGEVAAANIVAGIESDMALLGDGIETTTLVGKSDKVDADNLTISNMTIDAGTSGSALYVTGNGTKLSNVVVNCVEEYDGIPSGRSQYGFTINGSNSTVENAKFVGGQSSAICFGSGQDSESSVTTIDNCTFESAYYTNTVPDEYVSQLPEGMPQSWITYTSGSGIMAHNIKGTMNITNTTIESCIRALSLGTMSGKTTGIVNITDVVIDTPAIQILPLNSITFTSVELGSKTRRIAYPQQEEKLDFELKANVTFDQCKFTSMVDFNNSNVNITFKDCYYGDTLITAQNYGDYFTFKVNVTPTFQYSSN